MSQMVDIHTNKKIEISLPKDFQQIKKRQIIPIYADTKEEHLSTYFQILNQGDIPFILNSKIPKSVQETLVPLVTEQDSELGHFICTSGTSTNKPKIFFFELRKIIANAQAHNESLELSSGSKILFPLPFTHSFGLTVGIWASMNINAENFYSETSLGALDIIKNMFDKDIVYVTPPQIRQIIKYAPRVKEELPTPKVISIGSSILFENEAYQLQKFFPKTELFYTYGLTEMGPRVSTFAIKQPENKIRNLSLGTPLAGVKFTRENSELFIESEYACSDVPSPFPTNDEVDEDLVIKGRLDDTIIYQGRNVYPQEIENLLAPFGESALVGIKSKTYGEIPVLVFEKSIDENEVWNFLKAKVPETHLPKKIFQEITLPRTELGKIQKSLLKKIIKEKI